MFASQILMILTTDLTGAPHDMIYHFCHNKCSIIIFEWRILRKNGFNAGAMNNHLVGETR